jgi:putative transposase
MTDLERRDSLDSIGSSGKHKINFSTVFAGQVVGIREVDDQIWLVSFMDDDMGFFDNERGRVEPGPNPFVPDKVLTMCPE